MEAARQHAHRGDHVVDLAVVCGAFDGEGDPARAHVAIGGPAVEIADDRLEGGIGDEVERVASWKGAPRLHHLDEAGKTPLVILLAQSPHFRADRRFRLPLDEARHREIDEGEKRQHRGGEEREVKRRHAEGIGAQEAGHLAHSARSWYPAPRTVWRSGLAKPLSIFWRKRLICTSMTFVCGSK